MNNLKEIRKEKGMRQEDLGKLLNLERSGISKIESGSTDLSAKLIIKICEIFDCSADELLGLKERKIV